jgi:hypothetical protein
MIGSCVELQYIIELGVDEMVDHPSSNFTTAQRLGMLIDRRQAWARLDWKRSSVFMPSIYNAYELVAGVFAMASLNSWDIRLGQQFVGAWLPSCSGMGHQLKHPNIGLVARNFSVDPSQDLIAFVVADLDG